MSTVLFTTLEPALTTDLTARRHRRALPVIAAVAAGAVIATALVAGQPAAAEPAVRPVDASGTVQTETSTVAAVRAALNALPNRDQVHIDQILKNLAQGVMTDVAGEDDAAADGGCSSPSP